jgi:hypothetical protein
MTSQQKLEQRLESLLEKDRRDAESEREARYETVKPAFISFNSFYGNYEQA